MVPLVPSPKNRTHNDRQDPVDAALSTPALKTFEAYMAEKQSIHHFKAMQDLSISEKNVLDGLVKTTPKVEYRGDTLLYVAREDGWEE